jgi:protein-disulfide isomerase
VPVLEQLLEHYPTQVKIVFKQFPLRSHKFARKAASATIAAGEQGQFWPFHDRLFEAYNRLNDEKVEEIRKALNLDADQFTKAMASKATKTTIDKDIADGQAAGVRGTPTLFVNGKLSRDKSLNGLKRAVQQAIDSKK